MQYATSGKQGSLTIVVVTGTPAELQALHAAEITTRISSYNIKGDRIEAAMSRSDACRVLAYVEAQNTRIAGITTRQVTTRQLMLLATADRLGLSHGKSWYCTAAQADQGDPSFEGELVCYVY